MAVYGWALFNHHGCNIGFRAIAIRGSKMAIDLLRDASFNQNLVVLDLVMPELSEPKVFEKMKVLQKDIWVLIFIGYSLTHQVEQLMARRGNGFIQKPFPIKGLSQKIRKP